MEQDPYNLISRSKEDLIEMIAQLMRNLTPPQRIEFISRSISAQVALEEVGESNPADFIKKVKQFCDECLGKKYYIDPYDYHYEDYRYRSHYDDYDDDPTELFEESEWSTEFSDLLKLTVIHARNDAYEIANQAFDLLLGTLRQANFNHEILGTEDPMDYIDVDWDEVFSEKYRAMKQALANPESFAAEAIDLWQNFGEICKEPLIACVTADAIFPFRARIESVISNHINDWTSQHLLYELLKSLYTALSLDFDNIAVPKSLTTYNPNFWNDVVDGHIQKDQWEDAVHTIESALKQVTDSQVLYALNGKLVDSLEQLSLYAQAYEIAIRMYAQKNTHKLYLRARGLALKTCGLPSFIDQATGLVLAKKDYNYKMALLRIFSFEGDTQKLLETAVDTNTDARYNYAKFVSKSLLYRALNLSGIDLAQDDLNGYLESIDNPKLEGVADMIRLPGDLENKSNLILEAIDQLKYMVQFHIGAATRTRYARAAYYTAIIKGLYLEMDQNNDFELYYKRIMNENSKRPALKDEFRRKLG